MLFSPVLSCLSGSDDSSRAIILSKCSKIPPVPFPPLVLLRPLDDNNSMTLTAITVLATTTMKQLNIPKGNPNSKRSSCSPPMDTMATLPVSYLCGYNTFVLYTSSY
jgi:hypothetical protein